MGDDTKALGKNVRPNVLKKSKMKSGRKSLAGEFSDQAKMPGRIKDIPHRGIVKAAYFDILKSGIPNHPSEH